MIPAIFKFRVASSFLLHLPHLPRIFHSTSPSVVTGTCYSTLRNVCQAVLPLLYGVLRPSYCLWKCRHEMYRVILAQWHVDVNDSFWLDNALVVIPTRVVLPTPCCPITSEYFLPVDLGIITSPNSTCETFRGMTAPSGSWKTDPSIKF